MSRHFVSPGYMQEFQCLGGDCPDTCCKNWDIRIDKVQFDRMQACLSNTKKDKKKFSNSIEKLEKSGSSDSSFAVIKHNLNGACTFLDENKFCEIHRAYGIEPLSDICAFFPRVLSENNKVTEITGALSCPEVARLCLNSSDEKIDLSSCPEGVLPRSVNVPISNKLDVDDNVYEAKYLLVREALLNIINNKNYAIESRLYFIATLNNRLSQFYFNTCTDIDMRVEAEIKKINTNDSLEKLDVYVNNYEAADPTVVVVIQAVLQLAMQQGKDKKFTSLLSDIFKSYNSAIESNDELEIYGDNIPPEQLWIEYRKRWNILNSEHGIEIENYLTRYIANCFQREAFYLMPDPFIFSHILSIRVAILRFIITSHPRLLNSYDDVDNFVSENELLSIVTESIYLFARNIDQNHAFLKIIYQAISEQQMMSFDYALAFIKL